jgi:probable F420-dependent oxidoreductase
MTTQKYVREDFPTPPNFWEPLITYSYTAAKTTKLVFGTGILVLPMRRDIVVTAKQLATLDHFSKGRLVVAVGVGAYREEFEALQPGFNAKRGEMLEEAVQALRVLLTERNASWDGKYYQYKDVEMYPKPTQDPFPIYFGGNNINATIRAAKYGQGWMPAGMPSALIRERVALLHEVAAKHGRDGSQLDVAPQMICYVGKTHEEALKRFKESQMYHHLISLKASTLKDQATSDLENSNLIGSPQEVIERAKELEEAGVKHLCGTYFCADSYSELKDQMEMFAKEVMPSLS